MCDPTSVLALPTVALAGATVWLAVETRKATSRQIAVQTWLTLEPRFDTNDMKRARKLFAQQCDPYRPENHRQMNEEVLEFFESVGTAYKLGLLNKKLAASSFSWHGTRWWEAAKPYVEQERKRKGDDNSIFEEFEKFAKAMRKYDPKITSDDLEKFLDDEKGLNCN